MTEKQRKAIVIERMVWLRDSLRRMRNMVSDARCIAARGHSLVREVSAGEDVHDPDPLLDLGTAADDLDRVAAVVARAVEDLDDRREVVLARLAGQWSTKSRALEATGARRVR